MRGHLEVGADRGDQCFHAPALAGVQRHVFDRLRHSEQRGNGNDERYDAADVEKDGPAVVRYERGGNKPGNGPADRDAAHRDDRQSGAQVPRRRLGIDGNDVGNDAADANSRQQPQPKHLLQVARIGCGEREHPEQQVRSHQRGFASIAVADPAEQHRTEEDAHEARAEHRSERGGGHAPSPHQMRCGERDRRNVVTVDQDDEERPDDQFDLKRAEPALVEQA